MMTESQTPFDKKQFTDQAISAFQKCELLEWLSANRFFRSHDEYEIICGSLVELHNVGKIDLVASMHEVSNTADQEHNFWQLQSLYSKIIPDLEAQSDSLMDGVLNLVETGGQDLAANQPNAAFREWLERRPVDTRRLLGRAQLANEPRLKLLTFVLEAGVKQDFQTFFDASIDFLTSKYIENRLAAITALSRIDLSVDQAHYQRCLEALLSHAVETTDIEEVAQTISAVLDVHAKRSESENADIIAAIERASKQPTPTLHYLLARSLGRNASRFSNQLQIAIIKALALANPSLKGVIDQIDFAFSVSIGAATRSAIAECLESLLTHADSPLDFDDLDGLIHKLGDNHPEDLAWLVVHWLRNGCHQACLCLPILFRRYSEEGYQLNTSLAEFQFSDAELVFISKKALGYMLLQPTTAASILISCLNATSGIDAAEEISNLLFDPLLINFSGHAREVVSTHVEKAGEDIKHLKQTLIAHDEYLNGLRAVKRVPELQPSASERRIQAERRRQLSAQIFKDAEKHSVLLNMVTRQTLLHGTGSVYYMRDVDSSLRRSESHLASHGVSMEFPRFEAIDPVYLQNIIVKFRNEKLQS